MVNPGTELRTSRVLTICGLLIGGAAAGDPGNQLAQVASWEARRPRSSVFEVPLNFLLIGPVAPALKCARQKHEQDDRRAEHEDAEQISNAVWHSIHR
jgi:hypothetical protein